MSGGELHLEQYAADAKLLLTRAQARADEERHTRCTATHLLAVLLGSYPAVWRAAEADVAALAATCDAELGRVSRGSVPASLDERMLSLLSRAELIAVAQKVPVGAEQLVRALFDVRPDLKGLAGSKLAPDAFEKRAASAASRTPAEPRSEMVYLHEGRQLLRKAAAAHGLTDDEQMQAARANRLLDAVWHELARGSTVLSVARDFSNLLVVTRAGSESELRIEWSPQARHLIVTSRVRPSDATHCSRYAWAAAEGCWARTDAAGDFFEDLATKLDESFYAVSPGRS